MNNRNFGLRAFLRFGRTTPFAVAIAALSLLLVGTVSRADPINQPPPAGSILDLAGQPIQSTGTLYSVNFTAGLSSTAITFAFRNDPSFTDFWDPTLINLTTGSSTNLLLDSSFSSVYTNNGNASTPTDWTYANIYGASYGGYVSGGVWVDGAVQAYDAISQTVTTIPGDQYEISFYACCGSGGNTYYSALSSNGDVTDTGGNGIDILAYAQAGLPAPGGTTVPEPSMLFMLAPGLAGLAMLKRKFGARFTSLA